MHPTVSVDGIVGYQLVHEHTLRAQEDKIKQLKTDLNAANEKLGQRACELWNEYGKMQAENNLLRAELKAAKELIEARNVRDNQIRAALNEAKKDKKHFARLMNDRGQYSSGDIESFEEATPDSLADLVEFEIRCGAKTTFAAACLVLMERKYKDVVRKNSIYAERNAKLAAAIKADAEVAITN